MHPTVFNRATHFSLIWGVMLCFITIIEWRSLDREPLKKDILSPFIHRDVKIIPQPEGSSSPGQAQYIVELDFNGPLFLACFFIPIIIFHGIGKLWTRIRAG